MNTRASVLVAAFICAVAGTAGCSKDAPAEDQNALSGASASASVPAPGTSAATSTPGQQPGGIAPANAAASAAPAASGGTGDGASAGVAQPGAAGGNSGVAGAAGAESSVAGAASPADGAETAAPGGEPGAAAGGAAAAAGDVVPPAGAAVATPSAGEGTGGAAASAAGTGSGGAAGVELEVDPVGDGAGGTTSDVEGTGDGCVDLGDATTAELAVIDTTLLAPTPPMGWNSWNYFKSDISDAMLRQIADAMVSSGMKDVGYSYVNIDDTWMQAGREDGKLVADRTKFPNGIRALADYVHSLGLKLGIYGDRGTATCSNIAESGSYGYEEVDAQTFADWGIDYLKYDNCNLPGPDSNPPVADRAEEPYVQEDYEKMSAALKATGRPIVFSECAWGWKGPWMIDAGHLWRSTGDIADCWDNECVGGERAEWENGIVEIIDMNADMAEFAAPDGWNDPDMLEVGNGNLTTTEYISHFSLWAIMAAPLIAGNDLRNMTQDTKRILTNTEVIAVDQDPAGIQGTRIVDDGDLEVWLKPLGAPNGPEKAVVLFNRGESMAQMSVKLSDLGYCGAATARDLWTGEDLGDFEDSVTAEVEPHGVVMLKFTRVP